MRGILKIEYNIHVYFENQSRFISTDHYKILCVQRRSWKHKFALDKISNVNLCQIMQSLT